MKHREPITADKSTTVKTIEKRPKIKLKKRTSTQEKSSFESYLKDYFNDWEEENGN